ncbi:protein trachealess isoform X3 [Sitodiplosis mosellana]|uniref:protein trachealess isoform X3 n=1 Tax=Sitodiplosis mosellana TaxID=263140 RepID=UPI0024444BCD|nr:protein trachealess isoform X3 [Sitodiplosis mosellana]
MDQGGFSASPWAAMLGHHAIGPADPGFSVAHAHNAAAAAVVHHAHHGMPMDLHVQGFPYYRYRDDALCWTDRKMEEIGNPPSVNARILEIRKEKSRDAARSRRGKENFEFYELAKMLPLPAAITSQLDKASIIRLTISYLKLRDFSSHGDPQWGREMNNKLKSASRRTPAGMTIDLFEQHQGTHILQSLDGFALALASDGRFLYISETVSIYLGLSQVEMTGSSIFDYVHHQDHAEIAEQLGLGLASNQNMASPSSGISEDGGANQGTNNPDVASVMSVASNTYKGYERAFCIRMKSTLTKRGCHFKSSGYRVVLMLCRLRPQYTYSHTRKSQPPLLGMVALAIALPPPSVHEIRLETDMFVTRINFNFTIAHCEPKVTELLDYTAEELTGRNLYNLCHAEDADKLKKNHLDLINKGQVLTHYYRFMNKNGGYTWLQTCATVVCNSKNADEQNIICVNYVVSNRENENLILDCIQMENGLEHIIKHEDLSGDKGAGSPGNDPSDGSQTSHRTNEHTHKTPKSETPDPSSRARNRSSTSSSITNLAMDNTIRPIPDEHLIPTPVSSGSTARKGHKRKAKHLDSDASSMMAEPKVNGVALNINPSESHGDEHGESSVKDLENAMSKHLPSPINSNNNNSTNNTTTTDFSADSLLKQQQDKGSTIQWIGTHHNPFHQQNAPMPATALLRQLYANRESVIRATARQTSSGVYYPDGSSSGPLPTPPGSESSFDNQFLLHGHQKPDPYTNLVSPYGGYPSTMDYHNAMTPPSSVSPRESSVGSVANNKTLTNLHPSTTNTFDLSDSLRNQYTANGTVASTASSMNDTLPSLPLKPQPYSAAAAMHHVNSIDAYSGIDQSQYFSHHTGFHLYHKGAPSTGWYTTST